MRRASGLDGPLFIVDGEPHGKSVKQMLEAANAVVPKITSDQAAEMIKNGNTLVLDVRDAPEVAASGKVAGALHVSRGS